MTGLPLKVGTANIKNFPDMTRAQVRQDCVAVHKAGMEITLWQEIAEAADYHAIIDAFGNNAYGTSAHTSECVITWSRKHVGDIVGSSETIKIDKGMGPGSLSPPRYLNRVVLRPAKSWGLPDIEVVSIHFTNSAYNQKESKERQKHWDNCWANTRDVVLAARKAGRICIVGGDWNRRGSDIPKFAKDQVWIVGGVTRIDHVAILLPPGVALDVDGSTQHKPLNSDHDLRWREINLRSVQATPPPTPDPVRPNDVQEAIDLLAKARELVDSVGKSGGAWGVKALSAQKPLQHAINALIG